MPHIGQVIRILRVAKGWKQRTLAAKCMADQTAIGKYELGHVQPSLHILKKIAKAFDMPPSALIDLTLEESEVPAPTVTGLHRAVLDVVMAEQNLARLLS